MLLYPVAGRGLAALVVMPIIATALTFGTKGSWLAWLATLPLTAALFTWSGDAGWHQVLATGSTPGLLAGALIGLVVGKIRDLSLRLKTEVRQREATLEALPDLIVR